MRSRLLLVSWLTPVVMVACQDANPPTAGAIETYRGSWESEYWAGDYFPLHAHTQTVATYEFTLGGPGQFTVAIGGTETVPYTTGAITGVTVVLGGSDRSVLRNYQRTVSIIKTGDYYVSTDCELTAFPSDRIWGRGYDGMINSPDDYYAVKDDGSDCQLRSGRDNNPVLFQIQDVRVSGKEYKRALLLWDLHADAPFKVLDFQGKAQEMGITLPTAIETNNMEVDQLTILGYRKGLLASGQVSDFDGSTLLNMLELVAISRDRH